MTIKVEVGKVEGRSLDGELLFVVEPDNVDCLYTVLPHQPVALSDWAELSDAINLALRVAAGEAK